MVHSNCKIEVALQKKNLKFLLYSNSDNHLGVYPGEGTGNNEYLPDALYSIIGSPRCPHHMSKHMITTDT